LADNPLTLAELKDRCKTASDVLSLPELGEGAFVRVRGYSIGDVVAIQDASTWTDEGGRQHYNYQNDILTSMLRAIEEPKIGVEDTEWLLGMPAGVADKIIAAARRLGKRDQSAYDDLKASLRLNPYLRRLYTACAEHYHRLPSELGTVSEAEFNTALAAFEVEAEMMATPAQAEVDED